MTTSTTQSSIRPSACPAMTLLVCLLSGILLLGWVFTTFGELALVGCGVVLLATLVGTWVNHWELWWLRLCHKLGWRWGWLQKFPLLRRLVCVAGVTGLIAIGLIGLIIVVWPTLHAQWQAFIQALPRYVGTLHQQWQTSLHWLQNHPTLAPFQYTVEHSLSQLPLTNYETASENAVALSATATPQLPQQEPSPAIAYPPGFLQSVVGNAVEQLTHLVTASLNGGIYLLIGVVMMAYALMDRRLFRRAVAVTLPKPWQPIGHMWRHQLEGQLTRTVNRQVVMAVITSGYLYAAYAITHIPFAEPLSLLFGVCALIPGVGPWLGAIPNVVALIAGDHWLALFIAASGLIIIYNLKGLLFHHQKRRVALLQIPTLNPLFVLLAMVLCLQWLGPLGIIASVPVAVLFSASLATWQYAQKV